MLYKLIDGQDIYELNPELLAIPEFKLTDRQMKFVCLVSDRRSPLKSLPEKSRREKAALICGWKMEGNRLDKNARNLCDGKVESVERAIEKYREYQFDENQETLDTLVSQINEIKDFLKSDKSEHLLSNGKIVLDKNGDEIKVIDPKTLKLASDLGEKLPGLVEAKQKLETLLQISVEQKPEITTFSSADIPGEYFEEGGDSLPSIELYHQSKQKQSE